MTQGGLVDPRPVNGEETPSCNCSGPPHTSACRLHRWAFRHLGLTLAMFKDYAQSALVENVGMEPKPCGVARLPQAPELRRQAAAKLLILGRLQDGPALAAELVACGGGYRYSARIRELRAAGHNILSENLGDGIWRYTLVVP